MVATRRRMRRSGRVRRKTCAKSRRRVSRRRMRGGSGSEKLSLSPTTSDGSETREPEIETGSGQQIGFQQGVAAAAAAAADPIDTIARITGFEGEGDKEQIRRDLNRMADDIRTTLDTGVPSPSSSEDIAGFFARQQFGQSIVAIHVMHQLYHNIVECDETELIEAKFRLLIARSMLREGGIGDLSTDMLEYLVKRASEIRDIPFKRTLLCIGQGTDKLNAIFAKNALEEIRPLLVVSLKDLGDVGIVPTMFRYIHQKVNFSTGGGGAHAHAGELVDAHAGEPGGAPPSELVDANAGVNYHRLFTPPSTIRIQTGLGLIDTFFVGEQPIPQGVVNSYEKIINMCMASSIDYMCNECDIEKFPASITMEAMNKIIEGHEHELERVILVKLLKKHFVHPILFEIISATDSIMSHAEEVRDPALVDSGGSL